MNFSFYIFGTPNDYDQFPLDENSRLFKDFSSNQQGESQLVIYRSGALIYYTFAQKFNNDNYLGISLIFNGIYCHEPQKLFTFFDKLFSDIASKGELLELDNSANLTFTASKFLHKQQEINRIKTSLQSAIDHQFDDDFTPIDASFIISKGSTKLPVTESNEDIIDAIRKNGCVYISKESSKSSKYKPKKPTKTKTVLYSCIILTCLLIGFISWHYVFEHDSEVSKIRQQSSEVVDMPFILYSDTFTYSGQLKKGLPHGQGKAMFNSDDKDERISYEGAFINGYREGKGLLLYKEGMSYEGDFVNNKLQGSGTLKYGDGRYYEGLFSNNQKNGFGAYFDASGKQHSGIWQDDKLIEESTN